MFAGWRFYKSHIDDAAKEVSEPTADQAKSGNYRKAHVKVVGLDIALETPKGGVRRGVDRKGAAWETTMPAHYGYVKRTEGADGDHVDVSLGPYAHEAEAHKVYVIDQIDPGSGKFDEHKCQIGFTSRDAALDVYDASFSDWSGPKRRANVAEMTVEDFKTWLKTWDMSKPISSFKGP